MRVEVTCFIVTFAFVLGTAKPTSQNVENQTELMTVTDLCTPSPCGPNSICTVLDKDKASCSCLPDYIGAPPDCKPECIADDECPSDNSCAKNRCIDVCVGVCGLNAQCQVVNHTATCNCPASTTGSPLIECQAIEYIITEKNACSPVPCGPNTLCTVENGLAVCTCLPRHISSNATLGCEPECLTDSDCLSTLQCFNNRCQDPCPGSCGIDAQCQVVEHRMICTCPPNRIGDALVHCKLIEDEGKNICSPSPCGSNTTCSAVKGEAVCSCLEGYVGSPIEGCRPGCTTNSDCTLDLACKNQTCRSPCLGYCSSNAQCQVENHLPKCSCPFNTIGDPLVACYSNEKKDDDNGQSECTENSDCPNNFTCLGQRCQES